MLRLDYDKEKTKNSIVHQTQNYRSLKKKKKNKIILLQMKVTQTNKQEQKKNNINIIDKHIQPRKIRVLQTLQS